MHIELQDIAKSFGPTKVLKNLNLNVPPSSVIALVGENGAGKSTLLRILAGISVPDQGLVRYDSQIFDRENMALRRRLHFTPDMPLLFPDQTVARNIATFAALYGKPIDGREKECIAWLQDIGCARLMPRHVGYLSRGQMWKVGLACVAMIRPDLWLIDEPFASGMDAIGMGAFRRLARSLVDSGSTVIYTTQMIGMAVDFSDHVCTILGGEIGMIAESGKLRTHIAQNPNGAENILRGNVPEL